MRSANGPVERVKNTFWLNGFGFEEGVIAEGRRVVKQKWQEYGKQKKRVLSLKSLFFYNGFFQ